MRGISSSLLVCLSLVILSACSSGDDESISLKRPKGWPKPVALSKPRSWQQDYYSAEDLSSTRAAAPSAKVLAKVKNVVRKQLASAKKISKRLARTSGTTKISKIR